jgi:hypothetical protein
LIEELKKIKQVLENNWHQVFVWILDRPDRNQLTASQIMKITKDKIKESDLILCYIKYPEKSEWMLLELGIWYAFNKKIKILVKEDLKDKRWWIYWLTKDIIFWKTDKEFFEILSQI